jgi:hypothetical protein
MQSPELVPLNGAVASPAHGDIRVCKTQLVGRSLNMDEALENVTAFTESGRIDITSTVDRAADYNQDLVQYRNDARVLAIAAAGAAELDSVNVDVLQCLIMHWEIGGWVWEAKKDHKRYTGSIAARALHMIVRFGELAWSDLYTICGRVCGEKNCCYAIQRLRSDDYFVRRKEGRLEYFRLSPIVPDNVPVTGNRCRRDPVAFEATLKAGRVLIASRT